MIEDRKVKVNKRGKVVYTHDPYKKKRKPIEIVKRVALIGLVSGSVVCSTFGIASSFAYEEKVEKIANVAVENGYAEDIDKHFVSSKEQMAKLEEYMATSDEVTKEEYTSFLKQKNEIEDFRVLSLATTFTGFGISIAGLGTYLTTGVIEDRKRKLDRKEKHNVIKSFDSRYDEGWTRAELDIDLDNHDSYSIVEREQRKR